MKKTVALVVVFGMLFALVSMVIPIGAQSDTPSGIAINSESELLAMTPNGNYYLNKDITVTATYSSCFSGVLDGNGKKITIGNSGIRSVFAQVSGTVKNLTVNGSIELKSSADVAAVALVAKGSFENVVSDVDIKIYGFDTNMGRTGGLVSVVDGDITFKDCKNTGDIKIDTKVTPGSRKVWAGGFVGFASGNYTILFKNCVNEGNITSLQPDVNIGGFVGRSQGADVNFEDCLNSGALHTLSTGYTGIGGMIGSMYNKGEATKALNALRCVNEGKISAGDPGAVSLKAINAYAGGIIGEAFSVGVLNVTDCVNKGIINVKVGTSSSAAGGMAGMFITVSSSWSWAGFDDATYTFKNCVNQGDIQGLEVGGIVAAGTQLGFNKDTVGLRIESCVNEGVLSGADYAGGMLGRWANSEGSGWSSGTSDVVIKNCMNTGDVEAVAGAAGIFAFMEGEGILSTTASSITLGQKIGDSTKPTVVEGCVNAGTVICNSGNDNEDCLFIAAGIVAKTNKSMTIKDCVDLGILDMPVNDYPCLVHIIKTDKNITASNNVFLDSREGFGDCGIATAQKDMATVLVPSLLAFDMPELKNDVKNARALSSSKYTAESYAALVAECEKAEALFDDDTDITRVTHTSVSAQMAALDTVVKALVEVDNGTPPKQDDKDFEEEKKPEEDNIQQEEEKNTENTKNTESKVSTEASLTNTESTPTEQSKMPAGGGCGSLVGASAMGIIAALSLSANIFIKHKKG